MSFFKLYLVNYSRKEMPRLNRKQRQKARRERRSSREKARETADELHEDDGRYAHGEKNEHKGDWGKHSDTRFER